MMGGNCVCRRYSVENLAIGNITAVTTLTVNVDVSSAGLNTGDGVLVTPRGTALTNGISLYGHIVDSNTIGLDFVNASAGAIDPVDTFDFDVYVFLQTGNKQQAV